MNIQPLNPRTWIVTHDDTSAEIASGSINDVIAWIDAVHLVKKPSLDRMDIQRFTSFDMHQENAQASSFGLIGHIAVPGMITRRGVIKETLPASSATVEHDYRDSYTLRDRRIGIVQDGAVRFYMRSTEFKLITTVPGWVVLQTVFEGCG